MGKKKDKKWSKMSITEQNERTREMGDRVGVDPSNFKDYSFRGGDRGLTFNQDKYNEAVRQSMMNNYDVRRGLEAAGLAGDKKAAKISERGFANLRQASKGYDKLTDLKKEYVGGGGMGGAKNIASLTHALVHADRDNLLDQLKGAEKEDGAGSLVEQAAASFGFDGNLSPEPAKAFGYVDAYENYTKRNDDTTGRFGGASEQQAVAQRFADEYKEGVKKRLGTGFNIDEMESIF